MNTQRICPICHQPIGPGEGFSPDEVELFHLHCWNDQNAAPPNEIAPEKSPDQQSPVLTIDGDANYPLDQEETHLQEYAAMAPAPEETPHECMTDVSEQTQAPENVERRFCFECGAPLEQSTHFCPNCGRNQQTVPAAPAMVTFPQPKAKRKPWVYVLIASIALVVIAGGIMAAVIGVNNQREAAIKRYKEEAEFISLQIVMTSADIEKIGNAVYSNWYDYVYDNGTYIKKFSSPNDAAEKAYQDKDSDVSSVKSANSTIESSFKKLRTLPVDTEELKELRAAMTELYNAYSAYYDYILSPSGNFEDFTKKRRSLSDTLLAAYNKCSIYFD